LRAPLGFDLSAGSPPDLFRRVLEEGFIEFFPEPVYEKIFQRPLGLDGEETSPKVTDADFK